MSVTWGKVRAALAAALAMLLCLTGCGLDIGQAVSDRIKDELGEDVDISLGAGPSCLPEWVNFPDDDAANQGMKVPGGEVCVSSFFVNEGDFDANQSLPELADESDLKQLADMLLPLVLSQIPGGLGSVLTGSDEYGELADALSAADVIFRAYGEGQRVILLLVADGADVADYQLVIGAFCEGDC